MNPLFCLVPLIPFAIGALFSIVGSERKSIQWTVQAGPGPRPAPRLRVTAVRVRPLPAAVETPVVVTTLPPTPRPSALPRRQLALPAAEVA